MIDIRISDEALEARLKKVLAEQFEGRPEEMVRWVVDYYDPDFKRSDYSGILKWPKDALEYQRDVRNEWP